MDLKHYVMLSLVAAGVCLSARADAYGNIGCTILSEATRLHTVSRLDRYIDGGEPEPDPYTIDYNHLQVCDQTAMSVTRGYSAALAQYGLPVRWRFDSPTGECQANDIAHCHPFSDPAVAPLDLTAAAAVTELWYEIRSGVEAHMPWGTGSNVSYFRTGSLMQSFDMAGPISAESGSVAAGGAP